MNSSLGTKQRLYRRLATWSLLAPFVALAVLFSFPYIAIKVLSRSEYQVIHQLRNGVQIAIVIVFTGLVAGVSSLIKFKRYGKRGIFWKSIIGAPISLLLMGLLAVFGVNIGIFSFSFKPRLNAPTTAICFEGLSSQLKETQVVPTLDTPIGAGKNAIWCSSFACVWKTLMGEAGGDPLLFENSCATSTALNAAADPRPDVPAESLYTAAGLGGQKIVAKIIKELQQKFPSKSPPAFPQLPENSLVAYSYLEAKIRFPLPYFQNRKPLTFTDSSGKQSALSSFGIREEDDYAYYELRGQAKVLFKGPTTLQEGDHVVFNKNPEFAIDLSRKSSPTQIVIARINREDTLASAIKRIESEAAKCEDCNIGPNDVVLVPEIFWDISHRYTELEGQQFRNPKLSEQRLVCAQQDIRFRLDRGGAELSSEGKLMCLPIPTHFVLDRPFLIYMKKRGASMPFFAMWVDNAELLCPWK